MAGPRRYTSSKHSGISKSTRVHTYRSNQHRSAVLHAAHQTERKQRGLERRVNTIHEMSYNDREAVAEMDETMDYLATIDGGLGIFDTLPPGEEGFDVSHAGGEYEVFLGLEQEVDASGIKRVDDRNRRNRINVQIEDWRLQLGSLVDAYLEHQHNAGNPNVPPSESSGSFDIEVIDIFDRKRTTFQYCSTDKFPTITLMRCGYVASSPISPTVAFSVRTLTAFRQTRRVCPQFSTEAEVRKLCQLHLIPFRPYLVKQLSNTYDLYLEVLHRIDLQVAAELGRNTENWRLLNACAPCMYELEDEPPLGRSFHCEMDGNNSMKRLGAAVRHVVERPDMRTQRTDYWMQPVEVDMFKDEVPSRSKQKGKGKADDVDTEELDDWEDVDDSDPTSTCIKRWRNAGPEARKWMFEMFDETGIFLCACRHGMVLVMCDMIRSGELAKYPLAVVNKLLEVFQDREITCGYDIACAFSKTLMASSLGPKAREQLFRLIVGAFHGHAHNRGCQVNWHPLYVDGMGRSDFEGCERVFQRSNHVASTTRHASKFHRHQALEEHFRFWDEDKYAALSTFLSNHYREALNVIDNILLELPQIQSDDGITDADFEQYIHEERTYLQGLQSEPLEETLRYQYVKALQELAKQSESHRSAEEALNQTVTAFPPPHGLHKLLVKGNRQIRSALGAVERAEKCVMQIEDQLGIRERWDGHSSEYQAIKKDMVLRQYRVALDELERLVVQRLFELTKLNMSGTGYKLRTRIAKALQTRSEAIRNAITRYNTEAAKLSPPRPKLSWKQVVDYSFLGEFDLLREARFDIRTQPWADPLRREATVKYLRLRQARTEIERLNIEVRRLDTAIHDEEVHMVGTIDRLSRSNPLLATELQRQWKLRSLVNEVHKVRLTEIKALPHFSGFHSVGVQRGTKPPPSHFLAADPFIDDLTTELVNVNIVKDHDVAKGLEEATDALSVINN